ncbi:MAG: hypothetical protein KJO12_01500 [Ignavibacteria bacterium]|nr:hypothetical protein [Ignavibacteria bacterium]
MKKLLTLSLLSFLLFFGCNQNSEILTPVEESSSQDYSLISLPTPSGGLSVETLMTQFMEINGDEGGKFDIKFNYEGGPFGFVKIDSKLEFLAGAFVGNADISQTHNTDFASMTFGPSMQFSARVVHSLKIEGVDLSGVNPNTLDFVYIDAIGNMYPVEYEEVRMDASSGKLEVKNAILPHFSRYGFIN